MSSGPSFKVPTPDAAVKLAIDDLFGSISNLILGTGKKIIRVLLSTCGGYGLDLQARYFDALDFDTIIDVISTVLTMKVHFFHLVSL